MSPCRQNAELARLRQDCVRLGRELSERSDALRADEERRISLEAKMAAAEKELAQVQVRPPEEKLISSSLLLFSKLSLCQQPT